MQDRLVSHLAVLSLVVLATSAGACGGGLDVGDGGLVLGKEDAASTPAQTSGVSGTKPVSSMTTADKQKLCDWVASLYGGYGSTVVCTNTGSPVAITAPASQAECLTQSASMPATCEATVSQAEACTRAISTCDPNDDEAAADACTAMATCIPDSVVGSGGAGTGGVVGSGGAGGTPAGGAGGRVTGGVGGATGTLDAGTPDAFGTGGTGQTGGAGGVTNTGGSTVVTASGGVTTPGTTGNGGTTTPATTGAGGVAGTTGTSAFAPLCSGLLTAAGVAPTKNGICVDADPPLCYKTCGPQSVGFRSETCTAGVYVEQSGCSFPLGDYSCYKIPPSIDPSCPTDVPQATTVCSVAPCTLCNVNGGYLDSTGAAKTGYCVCPPPSSTTGAAKWSCAATTSWPCPAGQGC